MNDRGDESAPDGGRAFIVEQDETRTYLETAEQVCELLDRVETTDRADAWVSIDRGRRSWLGRLFGLSERLASPCFHLEKAGAFATLTFLDDAGSEYCAIDRDHPVDVGEDVRRKLSGGEPTPVAPELCMAAPRAFAAARHYLKCGARPDWFSYRYVR